MSELVRVNAGPKLLLRWHATRAELAELLRSDEGDCLHFDTASVRIELSLHLDDKAAHKAAAEFRDEMAAAVALLLPAAGHS